MGGPGQQWVGPAQAASCVPFITENDSQKARHSPEDPAQEQSASTEGRPYKGPLNWFPDRCCRMEGLELAASPSFLQTTCVKRPAVSAGPVLGLAHTSPEP